jgi:hypothetical protein
MGQMALSRSSIRGLMPCLLQSALNQLDPDPRNSEGLQRQNTHLDEMDESETEQWQMTCEVAGKPRKPQNSTFQN